jgi:DNA-binding NtrC family response regulator
MNAANPASPKSAPRAALVLLIDDEAATWQAPLAVGLAPFGFEVASYADPKFAIQETARLKPDVVLLDLHFPGDERREDGGTTGADLLAALHRSLPFVPVLVLTTRLSDDRIALDAFPRPPQGRFSKHQIGADPSWPAALAYHLTQAVRSAQAPAWPPDEELGFTVESAHSMRPFVDGLRREASKRLNTVIVGEVGIGRRRAARAFQRVAGASDSDMVLVACETLQPDDVVQVVAGLVQGQALILHELQLLAPAVQRALALSLATAGAAATTHPESRTQRPIVSTSSQAPTALVRTGVLIRDLALALAVEVLDMPPLRMRQDDLAPLFKEMTRQAAVRLNKPVTDALRPEVLSLLRGYDWPGNIPEFATVLARSVARTTSNILLPEDVEPSIVAAKQLVRPVLPPVAEAATQLRAPATRVASSIEAIVAHLDSFGGSKYDYVRRSLGGDLQRDVLLTLLSRLTQLQLKSASKELQRYLDPTAPNDDKTRDLLRESGIKLRDLKRQPKAGEGT